MVLSNQYEKLKEGIGCPLFFIDKLKRKEFLFLCVRGGVEMSDQLSLFDFNEIEKEEGTTD